MSSRTAAETSTELHNREVHPISLRRIKSLARLENGLEKFRPSTPSNEIPRESRRRGLRPRNADAAGCSSDTEPAHQKKKRRSTDSTDNDSSDLIAIRVVARGEDPSGDLWKQFKEKANPTRDETRPSNDCDEEAEDGTEDVDEESGGGSENVDDLPVDRILEDPNHDHNYCKLLTLTPLLHPLAELRKV